MTRRAVSREESFVEYRYGSVRVLQDGRLRLSPRTLPDVPELDFSARYVHGVENSERYVFDTENYSIHARCPWNSSFFMLYLWKGRVGSACFNYGLSPDELRKAVAVLRAAGGGLERWIVPGLEYTRDSLAEMNDHPDFPRNDAREKVILELLKATRDLPVAEPWERQRRQRERARARTVATSAGTPDGTVAKQPRKTTPRRRKSTG